MKIASELFVIIRRDIMEGYGKELSIFNNGILMFETI